MNDPEWVREGIQKSVGTIRSLLNHAGQIGAIGTTVVQALRLGNKVLTAGNGGSAAEAMHFAEELVGRFRTNRVSLPSVSLTADSSALTCIGNDFGFDRIFSRQVEGLGKKGDVLVLFSTSGRAPNLRLALEAAKAKGMTVVCLLGRDGGPLAGQGDFEVIVGSDDTERIQEAHQVILHLILETVEKAYTEGAA